MSAIHEFLCDSCKQRVPAKYNGEHYLPPADWLELMDPISVKPLGHICGFCKEKLLHVKKPKAQPGKK